MDQLKQLLCTRSMHLVRIALGFQPKSTLMSQVFRFGSKKRTLTAFITAQYNEGKMFMEPAFTRKTPVLLP